MAENTILVTGASGQLGSELQQVAAVFPAYDFHFFDRSVLPIDQPALLQEKFAALRPAVCINAAAYTAVDKAELEPEAAFAINGAAVGTMARLCNEYGALFIHVSTDYVFNGMASVPYKESDAVAPVSVYGASKLKGEELAMAYHDRCVVVRTSWVYSVFGKNFVKTMLRLTKEKPSLGVVSDQVGRPTYAADLAEALVLIANVYLGLPVAERLSDPRFHAVYHYADKGVISWFDLAAAIGKATHAACVVNPITTDQYPTPAKRPAYSVLDTAKIEGAFGLAIPEWEHSLGVCLEKLAVVAV